MPSSPHSLLTTATNQTGALFPLPCSLFLTLLCGFFVSLYFQLPSQGDGLSLSVSTGGWISPSFFEQSGSHFISACRISSALQARPSAPSRCVGGSSLKTSESRRQWNASAPSARSSATRLWSGRSSPGLQVRSISESNYSNALFLKFKFRNLLSAVSFSPLQTVPSMRKL